MVSISNKVTRLARMPQTLRVIRSIKALSEEVEGTNHKNILMAAYNLVKVCGTLYPLTTVEYCKNRMSFGAVKKMSLAVSTTRGSRS